jgi:hypothetical protein
MTATLFSMSCYHYSVCLHSQRSLPSKYFTQLQHSLSEVKHIHTATVIATVQDSLQANEYPAAVKDFVFYFLASHRMHFSETCS